MCFVCEDQSSLVDSISSISNIITAIAGFALAFYVFVYQRKKDSVDRNDRIIETTKNIRIDWFKTTIVQPNLTYLYDFYKQLHLTSTRLTVANLSLTDKSLVIEEIKNSCYEFRQLFIDLTGAVDSSIQTRIQQNIDRLLDEITTVVFDQGVNLFHIPAFNDKIEKPINTSKNDLFTILFSYQGH